ncbi:MAG TPA: type II toxin-antitoxin system VapC family toxin [Thermoanaerobaculia bacterium]|nr:type II toxin-antitoxin system VapC family toxin [Thermoanaerobaculia bacterium]
MEEHLILETTFLVDLERELVRRENGPAQRFLESNPEARLCVTFTIAGEIAAGSSLRERDRWESFLSPFRVLGWNRGISWTYGQLYRYLSENGLLIGANDLWIAATAIAHDVPLVTANERHFARVPDLDVRAYR